MASRDATPSIVAGLPIVIATALIGFATLFALFVRVSEPLAISPWESAIAMEAIRAKAGLPLYDATHATHMYGPLLTLSLAGIFSLTGLNLLAARAIFCAVGILLAFLCATIVSRGSRRKYTVIIFALFFAIGWRTNFITFSAQPDATAALLGITAITLYARKRAPGWTLVALALFLSGVFFKQTAAAFALVPVAYAVLFQRRDIARALLPIGIIFLALAMIRFVAPEMFHGMITVPASLTVHWDRGLPAALLMLASFPLLFLAAVSFGRHDLRDVLEQWVIASALVLVPLSIWTMLKSGGGYSSLFPGYLSLTALFAVRVDDWIQGRSLFRNAAVAVAMLGSYFFQFDKTAPLLFTRAADAKYRDAVEVARTLGAGVISPQDPTIAFRANGTIGRSIFFELDAHPEMGDWPRHLPEAITQEIRDTRYVVEAKSYVPVPQFSEALKTAEFRPINVPALTDSAYTIWGR